MIGSVGGRKVNVVPEGKLAAELIVEFSAVELAVLVFDGDNGVGMDDGRRPSYAPNLADSGGATEGFGKKEGL